jgi:hypothetical protein
VFNIGVVVFWLATMTWLVIVKVLPPLQVGEPPSYRSVYDAAPDSKRQEVAWEMLWNDRRIGIATTRIDRRHGGVTEVRSFVHFSRVPVDELAPAWLRGPLRSAVQSIGILSMDARSRLEIDPIGRLSFISSRMRVDGHDAEINIQGKVQGTTLKGTVRAGSFSQPFERYLPPDALMGDELSPQARMPGLRVGQEWTVPVYSPLRFSENRNPVDVLHAKVEGYETVAADDESVLTLAVVYRSDSGSILSGGQAPRGKMWVSEDGTVLKQTAYIFGSQLTFERARGKRAEDIAGEIDDRVRRFDQVDREKRRRTPRETYPPVGAPKQTPPANSSESRESKTAQSPAVSSAEPEEHTSKRGSDAVDIPSSSGQSR